MFLYISHGWVLHLAVADCLFRLHLLCLVVVFFKRGVPAAVRKAPNLRLLVSLSICVHVFVLFICVSCCWNVPVYQSQGGVIDLAVADCLFLLLFSLSGGRVLGGCLPSCTRFPILAGVTLKETTNFNKLDVHIKTLHFCS